MTASRFLLPGLDFAWLLLFQRLGERLEAACQLIDSVFDPAPNLVASFLPCFHCDTPQAINLALGFL